MNNDQQTETKTDYIKTSLWLIFIALLIVLLPHTAWAFGQFEPNGIQIAGVALLGWVAALAFEGAIASLTWRIKQRIEETPNYKAGRVRWRKFEYRYFNVLAVGLVIAWMVSTAANWAHAVEFGQPFAVFDEYSVPPWLYSIAFGAILPLCSLLFARILADERNTEQAENMALVEANITIKELSADVRAAEQRALLAEQRFDAIGDLAIMLTAEDKRERIRAVHQLWPKLPQRSVALIAETSPGYVSDTLSDDGKEN